MTTRSEQTLSKVYGDRADKFLRSCISELQRIYRNADHYGHTLEQISKDKEYLRSLDCHKRLPEWAEKTLWYVERTLYQQWEQLHIFTHVIDGKRYRSGHKVFEDRYHELLESKESYHCYGFMVDNRLVWLPVRQDDVEAEIASGRLSQDDITAIRRVGIINFTAPHRVMMVNRKLMIPVLIED